MFLTFTPKELHAAAERVSTDPAHAAMILRDKVCAYRSCEKSGCAKSNDILRQYHGSPHWWPAADILNALSY